MTVQEVIEYLEQHGFIADEVKDMCIEALVQVEQYRALGTVEEIKKKIKTELPYMSLAQARFKSELDEYRNIGTMEELREAREKQVAKKPNIVGEFIRLAECSDCHTVIRFKQEYCHKCGNKVDWEEGGTSD